MSETVQTELEIKQLWGSLWFTFWIFLVGGIVFLQFSDSAFFYYWINHQFSGPASVSLLAIWQLIRILHSSTALYFVWRASRESRGTIRAASRVIAALYMGIAIFGAVFTTYVFLFHIELP